MLNYGHQYMARFSPFEVLMAVALLGLGIGVVIPRLAQTSTDLRASQAELLEHRLQQTYDQWKLSPSGEETNLREKTGTKLTQQALTYLQSPDLTAPSLTPMTPCRFVDAEGVEREGLMVDEGFLVAFDGNAWHVAPVH